MEQIHKNLWNSAGKAGFALGLVSSAYLFINQFTAGMNVPFLSGILSFILWAAKFGGCIWLMKFFMTKFVSENTSADNSTSFKFGVVTALLSAMVYAAFSFANTAYFSADMIAENMDTVMQAYSQFMDSNTLSKMDKMIAKMPQITFFSNLIYCFIFGTILSLILSRNIPNRNPFASDNADEQ